MDFLGGGYVWVKVLHVLSVITWMAGLFYLPRLFVYHAQVEAGSQTSELFKTMERRLLKGIMNPSLIVVLVTGFAMFPLWMTSGWMHAKLLLVVLMAVLHMLYGRWRRQFAEDRNVHDHKFYRVMNEAPTVLLIAIVILVLVKPF